MSGGLAQTEKSEMVGETLETNENQHCDLVVWVTSQETEGSGFAPGVPLQVEVEFGGCCLVGRASLCSCLVQLVSLT